jgi:hypothetical protein
MSDEYLPMPFTVIGLDVPDTGDEAAMLGLDQGNRKIAVTVDFASLLALLENSTRALQDIGFRQRGSFVHVPARPSVGFDSDQPDKIAIELQFGTIGNFRVTVTRTQAEALQADIGAALAAARSTE